MPLIRFHCSMSHKVHLDILKSYPAEQIRFVFHGSLYRRMSRIQCISSVQFLWCPIRIKIHVLVFVFGTIFEYFLRIAPPIRKGRPIYSRLLPIILTYLHKRSQLLFCETIPAGIQSYIHCACRTDKRPVLQMVFYIFRNLYRFLISQIKLQDSPAIPTERNSPLPFPGRSYGSIRIRVCFQSVPPIRKVSDKDFGRLQTPSHKTPMGFGISCLLICHTSIAT